MPFIHLLVGFVVSMLTSMVGLPWLLRLSKRRGLYDMPNERKVHRNKIPRIGGMVFFPSMLVSMGAVLLLHMTSDEGAGVAKTSTLVILAGVVLIYLIGVLDDILGLDAKFKFLVQLVASSMMPVCGLYINDLDGLFGIYELPLWFSWLITIFLTLLLVNSMNLIDGIDGLSSSLAVIALSSFTVLFAALGQATMVYALLAVSLLGAVLVFMYYNLFGSEQRCTKTFMGDAGSLILGYTIAFLVIKYSMYNSAVLPDRPNAVAMAFTLVVVPTFDLVRVACTRLLQHKSIFEADKQHIHHLCLERGMTMRRALVLIVALQLAIVGINYVLLGIYKLGITLTFITDIVVFAAAIVCLKRK